MATIIQFNPAPQTKGGSPLNTSKAHVTKMQSYSYNSEDDEDDDDDLCVDMSFVPLDDARTALVGNFADIRYLLYELDGGFQERKSITDPHGVKRGPGIILSVEQVSKLIEMMDADGWEGITEEVRRSATLRTDYKLTAKPKF